MKSYGDDSCRTAAQKSVLFLIRTSGRRHSERGASLLQLSSLCHLSASAYSKKSQGSPCVDSFKKKRVEINFRINLVQYSIDNDTLMELKEKYLRVYRVVPKQIQIWKRVWWCG